MKKYISKSKQQTKQIAKDIAKIIKTGVIALTGDLGAGKTTFTQGFGEQLGIKGKIISPTFVLIKEHKIPSLKKNLYHIDLYRVDDNSDIQNLGILELINDPNNLILIEWAEKIEKYLPKKIIKIVIKKITTSTRQIEIENL